MEGSATGAAVVVLSGWSWRLVEGKSLESCQGSVLSGGNADRRS